MTYLPLIEESQNSLPSRVVLRVIPVIRADRRVSTKVVTTSYSVTAEVAEINLTLCNSMTALVLYDTTAKDVITEDHSVFGESMILALYCNS